MFDIEYHSLVIVVQYIAAAITFVGTALISVHFVRQSMETILHYELHVTIDLLNAIAQHYQGDQRKYARWVRIKKVHDKFRVLQAASLFVALLVGIAVFLLVSTIAQEPPNTAMLASVATAAILMPLAV